MPADTSPTIERPVLHDALLRSRMLAHPRTFHYRLPRSRGGTARGENIVQVNHDRDSDWHILFENMVGKEVAAQLTVWWKRGYIFRNYDRGRFECRHVADKTRWRKHWRRLQKITLDMSNMQQEAWKRLFCFEDDEAPPGVMLCVANDIFLHPDTPLTLIESRRSPLLFWKRR